MKHEALTEPTLKSSSILNLPVTKLIHPGSYNETCTIEMITAAKSSEIIVAALPGALREP